ncbi:MAG: pyruvate, phosphate dikinase [Candidatus Latescibacteria bacterium]|nr:pyruvate, phosphate dikinase [Candidatus Latescibacterota bacterium]
MDKKYVYFFGGGKAEGNAGMRSLLGGKGANLAEMTNIGLPVPPGYTISTEACKFYYEHGETYPPGLEEQIEENLTKLETVVGKKLGDIENPLLVSVRSGAPISMPGMMDTVLNLGLNDQSLQGLINQTGDERFAYDSYRRFIMMFSDVVLSGEKNSPDYRPGLERLAFEKIFDEVKKKMGAKEDTDVDANGLKEVVERSKEHFEKQYGKPFPSDPREQLRLATNAVFKSWNNKRACDFRRIKNIPDDLGTAVNVQTMVFGNMGENSGTGVAFTRDPSTGQKKVYGNFLANAQGEDVVAGIRQAVPIDQMQEVMPGVYQQLLDVCHLLEKHYKDIQDIEFTIEKGKLYMLQCRSGKPTATGQAVVKIAVDMALEGLLDENIEEKGKKKALLMVEPQHIDHMLHRQIDPRAKAEPIAKGVNASSGAATGAVVFSADDAERLGKAGEKVILVRPETTPDDVHGFYGAQGILTQIGGATSHAALVARGMGKPCVAGCDQISIDLEAKQFTIGDIIVKEGDIISIDGTTGRVFLGEIPTIEAQMTPELQTLLSWADQVKRLGVWANADYPHDATRAREFGAQGIGLCRTEHMFMETDRLPIVQEMILAKTEQQRHSALDRLLPLQREDFKGIFRAMNGLPVIIRLIDPPLHEFLPDHDQLLVEATELRIKSPGTTQLAEKEKMLQAVESMREQNPMLGLRGCRLGLVMPEIIEMQVRAILEAACEVKTEGVDVHPEIMIPLVGHVNELKAVRQQLEGVAKKVMEEQGVDIDYKFGTMIEIPRAALTAGEIAKTADFFSFGTNDLTQTTFGISRDDAEAKFLMKYVDKGILPANPFQTLDQTGVGVLIRMAVEAGRQSNPNLEVGICGEHGGDPASIEFCHRVGLNYVSCSPYRVPIARLAAAHAALKNH